MTPTHRIVTTQSTYGTCTVTGGVVGILLAKSHCSFTLPDTQRIFILPRKPLLRIIYLHGGTIALNLRRFIVEVDYREQSIVINFRNEGPAQH